MNQTWENGKKPSFEQNFGPFGQIWAAKNFSQILLHQSLDIMISYHHVLLSGKIYDPILKKFNDGWKDRQTDREVNRQERLDKMLFD